MNNPYPRRNELPTPERKAISEIDSRHHAASRDLSELGKLATHLLRDPSQLYDDTYLDLYIDQVEFQPNELAAHTELFKATVHRSAQEYLAALNEREALLQTLPELTRSLLQPVRDFTDARIVKAGNIPGSAAFNPELPEAGDYRSVEIQDNGEPLASLLDYGIHCRSYYSRPNGVTGEPVPGVKPDVFVRESIAEKLVDLNNLLKLPEVIAFFGDEVELFVDEGYRSPEIQQYLHDEFIPQLITKQLASEQGIDLTTASDEQLVALKEEMLPIRDKKIARPAKKGQTTPGPHQTGSAVDLTIRYKQDTTDLVPRVNIWFGKDPANLTKVTDPDHFEHAHPTNQEELVAQQNLRAWHALLNAVDLTQNPTEFWHAGSGDQLSVVAKGGLDSAVAHFGWPAIDPETYVLPTDTPEK